MLVGYRSRSKVYAGIIAALLNILCNSLAEEKVPNELEKLTEQPNVTKPLDQIPQYHFRYYVQDANSGDYKTQEERRDGERVQGSYSVAEPNGDLRVVTYTADIKSGFRADVKFHPGASPMGNSHRQTKSNRTAHPPYPHRNAMRSNFTPSKPRHVPTASTTLRYQSVGDSGLKTLGLHDLRKLENKPLAKELVEKDSVVVEMHLNDGTTSGPSVQKPDEKKTDTATPQSDSPKQLPTTSPSVKESSKLEKSSPTPSVVVTSKPEKASPLSLVEEPLKLEEAPPKRFTTEATQTVKLPAAASTAETSKPESIKKAIKDKVRVEVEQIITSTLHQPISVREEIQREAALADKDLRGIHRPVEARSASANDKEELHISVHESVRPDDPQSRAQKKYSTIPRPLRLVEQVPAGNYQLQSLAEPTPSPIDNGNSYNNYDQPGFGSNYYYDPTLAAAVSNYYPGSGVTHLSGNSLKPSYDENPYIGYEWVKMLPRMVNTNGESYIVMDPDYKTFFGYPRPTTLFHQLTKNKFAPHVKPQDNKYELNKPQEPPATSPVKEPIMKAVSAENSPKHDQQVPQYFRKAPEKADSGNLTQKSQEVQASQQNLTQKYLESLQAAPQPYPMVPAAAPSSAVVKLPVIQPATINPIPAYAWSAGPVAINPAIAFILLPLQTAQDPPIAPIVVN
ncbi:unnamed protein product [Bemisia tabaci]|uniref:Cuticular protein n=1 Tax=Bemisia tabaci TaxID=7038 RepID=A0A9P0A309_BEMTA|nr:unnamed protein product [Bemisia tabaci]